MKSIHKLFVVVVLGLISFTTQAQAAVLYSQPVNLASGWNIVSTPRVLDSHTFSATETSANFDIYVLDSSSTSGWSTMSALGQTEFTPLYGYFVNNKTGASQTLTFNYKSGTTPNERLFSRAFTKAGWYSLGVANPTYALAQGVATSTDTNNPTNILSSLQNNDYNMAVDFTAGNFVSNVDSVAVSNMWDARSVSDGVNKINDLRDTKGYAVYILNTSSLYSGFQNDSIPQCSDGIDNDGDGRIDYPADVGCANAIDNDEFNPTPALAIAVSSTPAAQTVVAGAQGVTLANYQFDATQSGEDIRFSSLGLTASTSVALSGSTILSSCQLFDGSTALNGGSNVVNPTITATAFTATAATFTLDSTMTVTKGTVKTLALKCNVASGATGSLKWGITSTQIGAIAATGVTSSVSVTPSGSTNNGQLMTLSSAGTVVVSTDSSSPSYKIAAAGSTGVTLGVYKFRAANESVNLTRIGLALGAITASSTSADLTTVTLWNGATQIGSATFVGANRNATSTLSSPLVLTKDTDVAVTIKGDLAAQGASEASAPGALLTVDVDVNTNTQGTGVQSGSTINATGSTAVAGVRVFKSYPTVAQQTGGMSSTLIAQSGIDLYRFSIAANAAGDVALDEVTVNVATSSASTANGTTSVTNLKVYAYTDSAFSNAVSGFTSGQVVATVADLVNGGNNVGTLSSVLTIPAGQTYYFKVVGDVSQVAGTTGSAGTVTTRISGDAAYPSLSTLLGVFATGLGNFIWSPVSTTTAATTNIDWTNGFNVAGLPSGGTNSFTLTK